MAYVQSNGRVKLGAFPRPLPRYDFEPVFMEPPDEAALYRQASMLVTQTIELMNKTSLGLEFDDEVSDEWRIDWGQKIASGTHRKEIERLVAEIPSRRVAKIMLRAIYRAAMEMINLNKDAFTRLMGIYVTDAITEGRPNYDPLQLSFSRSEDEEEQEGEDEGGTAEELVEPGDVQPSCDGLIRILERDWGIAVRWDDQRGSWDVGRIGDGKPEGQCQGLGDETMRERIEQASESQEKETERHDL